MLIALEANILYQALKSNSGTSNNGTGCFASSHILTNVCIPEYDNSKPIHKQLSKFSKDCHEKKAASIVLTDPEKQIDELEAEMWGIPGRNCTIFRKAWRSCAKT